MRNNKLVSVSLITYNQKAYIAQAIESIISQKTNFNYELIIGDDCSTDGTREIVIEYQEKYPNIIFPILHKKKNEGIPGKLNFLSTIFAAKGKYIALLDGDDYWTDNNKLQKQVDFLEANPDYAICFHSVQQTTDDKTFTMLNGAIENDTLTLADLSKENFIPTLSVVFRNKIGNSVPEWFYQLEIGDYPIHLLNARHGKIKFLPDIMGVYRKHGRAVWSSQSSERQSMQSIQVLNAVKEEFKDIPEVYANLQNRAIDLYCRMAINYFKKEKIGSGMDLLEKAKIIYPGIHEIFIEKYLPQLLHSIFDSRKYKMGKTISQQYQKIKSLVQGSKAW